MSVRLHLVLLTKNRQDNAERQYNTVKVLVTPSYMLINVDSTLEKR